jgi:hypothetical protein
VTQTFNLFFVLRFFLLSDQTSNERQVGSSKLRLETIRCTRDRGFVWRRPLPRKIRVKESPFFDLGLRWMVYL